MEAQAIAYTANYASVVFKIVIECLEKNGALRPGPGSDSATSDPRASESGKATA